MVPPASHRVSRVPWYSGSCLLTLDFVYWTFTFFGLLSQNNSTILYQWILQSSTPMSTLIGLAFFPFARRYLGNRFFFLFLLLLRCPVVLWILPPDSRFRLLDFHLLWFAFPKQFDYPLSMDSAVLNPNEHAHWFGLFPFRSPLLRKSIFLSLPVAT